ncbi:MAG: sensor histidine kinase [Gammaproteobacteria bacterium]
MTAVLQESSPESGQRTQFIDLMASTIHDMKNSLGIVLHALEELGAAPDTGTDRRQLQILQFEAKKISNKLIQLLSFYKMSHAGLCLNIDEHEVADLLLESLLLEKPVIETVGLGVELQADESLTWALDRELVIGVLGNAINNAMRHAHSRLLLMAEAEGAVLRLTVNDDGPGFPEELLSNSGHDVHGVSFASGNTGLGLSFSAMIAELHRHGDHCGTIELSNGGPLGGACFVLTLP